MPPAARPAFHHAALPARAPRARCVAPRCVALPPRRIAAVASDLRHALQASLRARTSRIDVVLPPGAKLGTETRASDEDARARQRAGDRELARLLVGMFERTGLAVRAVFPSRAEHDAARNTWGGAECQFACWDAPKRAKPRRGGGGGGFGSAAEGSSDDDVDVFVIVGGGAKVLVRAEALAKAFGQDKLVILANANSWRDQLPLDVSTFREEHFESVYHYMPNPHPKWSGGVLFRKFPDDWVLGRLTGIGTLQQLLVTPDRPSLEDIGTALGKEGEKRENELLKKLSTFMDWGAS